MKEIELKTGQLCEPVSFLMYISLDKNRDAQNCVRCDVRSSHGKQVEEYCALECDVTQSDRRQHQGSTQTYRRGQQVLPKLSTYPLNYTVDYLRRY
jgi:hypothetical protein